VAIDIGKRFHAVLVEQPDGTRQRFQLASTREDYDRLVGFLQARSGPVRIALEPTGNLHRTLAYRLLREGFPVVSVSSVAGARYREAMFNSWDKNDPKDATVILHLLKHGIVQHYHDPLLAGDHDLQELSKTYQQITLARKRLADSLLNHYLPLYFPEMARYWESTRVAWFVAFLTQFPTPGAICALSREAFVQAAGPLVGRKVHKRAKLDELYELAHRSIGLPVRLDSPAIETFRLQLEQLRRLATLREALEARAHALL
jgi:transposase